MNTLYGKMQMCLVLQKFVIVRKTVIKS